MRKRIIRFLRNLPLKRKLALVTLITCTAALVLACAVLLWFQTKTFLRGFVAEIESLALITAHNSAAPITFQDRRSAAELLSALSAKPQITSASILDNQGHVFAHYGGTSVAASASAQPAGVQFSNGNVVVFAPINFEGSRLGTLRLQAQFSEKYRELISLYLLVMGGVIGASLVIILFFSAALQKLIAGPIASLARVAQEIALKEDFSVRAPQKGQDEVGLLTAAFNRMLDQIQSRDAGLRSINTKLEREILERRKAEAELRESRERYEVAIVGSNDGIWDWKIEKNEMFFSSRWKAMLGYMDHELSNTREMWEGLLHPDDKQAAVLAMDAYLNNKRPHFEIEYRMRHKSGTYCWIHSRGAALRDQNGKPVRMAGSHTDITRRKEAETELAQLNRRVQDASRLAGMAEVATGVLHNVGNVLNSVSVISVTLKEELEKSKLGLLTKTSALIRENMTDIGSYLSEDPKGRLIPDFLLKLTDELDRERTLALSKVRELVLDVEHIKEIVAMQQSIARICGVIEPLVARELVEDTLRIHAVALEHHQINVEKRFEPVPRVMVDRHKVLQILLNVVRNAKYAMDESSNRPKTLFITIHARKARFVTIEIKDNGVGIASENLTKIFSHGFTTKRDGHGFGLHSGANAAREMGGGLMAQSDGPGLGATFTLELPIHEPEPQKEAN